MKSVAVIIVNYKTPDLTIGALESLVGEVAGRNDRHVIVVDNCSSDNSGEQIARDIVTRGWSDWAEVVMSPVNGGFGAGNNIGIKAIEAEYYLLLNSDAMLLPGALDTLCGVMTDNPKIGLLGPKLLGENGEPQRSFFRFQTPVSEFLRAAKTGPIDKLLSRFVVAQPVADVPVDVDWVSFACVLIRRSVMDDIGLLDEEYFMYFEDIDYCRRAGRAGWRNTFEPSASAIHLQGGTATLTADSTALRRLPRYYFESRARYFGLYYGGAIGVICANLCWSLGRGVSFARETFGKKQPHTSEFEFIDNWINCFRPNRRSSYLSADR